MATLLTDKTPNSSESPKTHKGGTLLADPSIGDNTSALTYQSAAPTSRPGRTGIPPFGYIVGGLVATVGVVAILVSTVLPTSRSVTAPSIPTANTATLPAMSNDMGFWDRIHAPAQASLTLPAMSNDMGFWDRIHAPVQASLALPAMSNDMGFWDRIQAPVRSTLLPVTHGVGFHNQVNASAASLPAMSNSMGFWDRIQAPMQTPLLTVSPGPRIHNQVNASAAALPAMSNDMGFWDRIPAPHGQFLSWSAAGGREGV
jgi:hypothetical protein